MSIKPITWADEWMGRNRLDFIRLYDKNERNENNKHGAKKIDRRGTNEFLLYKKSFFMPTYFTNKARAQKATQTSFCVEVFMKNYAR